MCRRYTHLLTWSQIVELYRLTLPEEPPALLTPSYNVARTHVMPIIRPAGNGREDRELGQVEQGIGAAERNAIVRADRLRQATLGKELLEGLDCCEALHCVSGRLPIGTMAPRSQRFAATLKNRLSSLQPNAVADLLEDEQLGMAVF